MSTKLLLSVFILAFFLGGRVGAQAEDIVYRRGWQLSVGLGSAEHGPI